MYPDLLKLILRVIEALDALDAEPEGTFGDFYVGRVPIMWEGDVVGHVVDEVGGAWSYQAVVS